MRAIVLGFIIGVVMVHQLPALPGAAALVALCLSGLFLVAGYRRSSALGLLGGTCLGAAYAATAASGALEHRLPPELEGSDLRVEGRIAGLPRSDGFRSVFVLIPDSFPGLDLRSPPRRLRLSWYDPPPALEAGQRWAFTVRLKQPRGMMNPGAFDYERWLFTQRIDAVGYVRGDAAARGAAGGVDALRARLASRIEALLGTGDGASVVRALAVADRRGIGSDLWRVLNETGTGHLLAISGLHIGLAAGAGGFLAGFLWRRSALLCRYLPPRIAGVGVGLVVASAYAILAGLGLPTRRALLMTGVAAVALLCRRHWRGPDIFLWALALVLAAQPLAPLGAGLWLSFWAVAVLLLAANAYTGGTWQWARMQLAVSCGLFPLTVLWFGHLPWISPVANAVAVPVVSLVAVPLVFAGLVMLPVSEAIAAWPLNGAAAVVEALLAGLVALNHEAAVLPLPAIPTWVALAACAGVVLACIPGRWAGRPLAMTLLLPALVYRPAALPLGEARLTITDVGQGTGIVVETRNHALVYDAGPRLGRTDGAETALLPVLKRRDRNRVDLLMVSHADADHAGGLGTLLASDLEIRRIMAGEPLDGAPDARLCRQGQHWEWDRVHFAVLHPAGPEEGNDASCVVRITSASGVSALLPGDISSAVERRLIDRQGLALNSELLLVPHHGSASSSSPAFVSRVAPREAVFTTGYRNRYGLPDGDVVRRYLLAGTAVRESPLSGALTYRLGATLKLDQQYRHAAGRYFHGR